LIFNVYSLARSQNGKPKNPAAHDIAQENQAVKRQKLDGGRPRQVQINFIEK
jgi:hypothetical protein